MRVNALIVLYKYKISVLFKDCLLLIKILYKYALIDFFLVINKTVYVAAYNFHRYSVLQFN